MVEGFKTQDHRERGKRAWLTTSSCHLLTSHVIRLASSSQSRGGASTGKVKGCVCVCCLRHGGTAPTFLWQTTERIGSVHAVDGAHGKGWSVSRAHIGPGFSVPTRRRERSINVIIVTGPHIESKLGSDIPSPNPRTLSHPSLLRREKKDMYLYFTSASLTSSHTVSLSFTRSPLRCRRGWREYDPPPPLPGRRPDN